MNPEKLFSPHRQLTIERIKEHPVVLLLSDSSSLDFSGKSSIKGMGRIRAQYSRGIWIHPTIAVSPDRLCLGVIGSEMWTRDLEIKRTPTKINDRKEIELKESHKWIKSYQAADSVAKLCPKTQVINIVDREADIMELILECQKSEGASAELIIRSSHNRISQDGENLKKKLKESPSLGEIAFKMEPGKKRKEREVKQTLKAIKFSPRRKWFNGKRLEEAEINVVLAKEENPPEGKKGIEWAFLTTLPINNPEEVKKVVEYYLCRWQIEIFFKVLKSGCKVEDHCLQTMERMENLISMYMIIAWRVMYLMMLARSCPEVPARHFLPEEIAGILLSKRKKAKEQTIKEAVGQIAKMGGYPGRKNDPPPGPKVIWKGLQKISAFFETLEFIQSEGKSALENIEKFLTYG